MGVTWYCDGSKEERITYGGLNFSCYMKSARHVVSYANIKNDLEERLMMKSRNNDDYSTMIDDYYELSAYVHLLKVQNQDLSPKRKASERATFSDTYKIPFRNVKMFS
ncbi:predicted protein [Arabidopsis lyrata subsp. lyrata]|uniref:Predicted protein n=1 Tax=Arabidopsis lyrata subsp. lyrata TaxID=81972 RepID=D7MI64_ARALL|nr:predicted protein [Arabidopsis lyrata subsp. lyrata]